MVQRTVLKVRLSCEKCRKKILKSVSGLYGDCEIKYYIIKIMSKLQLFSFMFIPNCRRCPLA
ncbi:hypothetical protein Hanom_Chr14g01297831 [Helianthus anomalus]